MLLIFSYFAVLTDIFSCVFINLIVFFAFNLCCWWCFYIPCCWFFYIYILFFYCFLSALFKLRSVHFILLSRSTRFQFSRVWMRNVRASVHFIFRPHSPVLCNCQPYCSLHPIYAPRLNRCACLPSVPTTMLSFFICRHNYFLRCAPSPHNTRAHTHSQRRTLIIKTTAAAMATRIHLCCIRGQMHVCVFVCVFCVFASTHLMRTRWLVRMFVRCALLCMCPPSSYYNPHHCRGAAWHPTLVSLSSRQRYVVIVISRSASTKGSKVSAHVSFSAVAIIAAVPLVVRCYCCCRWLLLLTVLVPRHNGVLCSRAGVYDEFSEPNSQAT